MSKPTDEQFIEQLRTMGLIRAAERMQELLNAAAEEREACAQLVDELVDHRVPASTYSSTIRARGGE